MKTQSINRDFIQKFIDWTRLKIITNLKDRNKFFSEREIWWSCLGINIGDEQDGKNKMFERPVLILKKFNHDIFWGLPLTSKIKNGKYYHWFNYNDEKYSIILSQLRLMSSKRLLRKIRTFPNDEFIKVKNKIKSFL